MIIHVEYVRAVKVGWTVAIPQIERIVAVIEEPQGTLFVKRA